MTAPLSAATTHQLGKVARGGAINFIGAVISATTSFGLIVVVANTVSDTDAGSLFAATSLVLILFSVATLGTDTGLARFLLPLESQHRYGQVLGVLRAAYIPVCSVAAGLGLTVFVAAPWLGGLVGLSGSEGASILRVIAITVPFAAVFDLALSTTRAFSKMRPTVVLDDIFRSLFQVGAVAVAAAIGAGAIGLTAASNLPYVVGAALAVTVALKILAERRRRWTPTPTGPVPMTREFWTYTWPRSVARITQIIVQRLDIVLVALLLDATAAAVYTAATRFVVFGQLAGQAIYRVLQPRFSALLGRDEQDTVRDVFKISTAWTMAASWPIYIGVACGAPLYMRIFGYGSAADGVVVVVVMALAMMLAMATGPLDTLLLMAGHSVASLLIAVTAMAVDVVGCLVLIPHLGISGAAIAWGGAVTAKTCLGLWQVHRATGLVPFSPAAAIVGATVVFVLGVPLLLVGVATDWAPLLFVVTGVGTVAAYCAALWWAREPLALDAIISAFRPRPTRDPEHVT